MKSKQLVPAICLIALLSLVGCSQEAAHGVAGGHSTSDETSDLTPDEIAAGVLSAMDRDADACQDFYRYACGGWLDTTELPGDESRWARSFSEIDKRNREVLREILESAGSSKDREMRRLGSYYASCMDEETIDKLGLSPLDEMLGELREMDDMESLWESAGRMHKIGAEVLFDMDVFGDLKDPELNITNLFQGGLGLPDRDYYLDESKADKLALYEEHVANMFRLAGDDDGEAVAAAGRVVAFETELAKVSRTRTEMRQVEKLYQKIDRQGLRELMPASDWSKFFILVGYPKLTQINVGTPEFFEGLEELVNHHDPEGMRNYMRWHLLHHLANRLPSPFVEENFDFFGVKLSGQKEMRPRWRRCVAATSNAMGELLGRAFVDRKFAGDSKKIALEMIHGIENAFESGLTSLTWMDEATRGRAKDKKEAIVNKIGYPDKWRDYSDLDVDKREYLGNVLRAAEFEFRFAMDKAEKPVDRTEWGMNPPDVNAYYNPLFNEMVFPAGILQEPFFHRNYPPAMNFGGIGMVMGHELTHGFDDMGSKFDPQGKMEQWWDDSAIENFNERTRCVSDLYSTYEVQPGLFVNGELTLGENIADLGGIKEAYRAYQAHASDPEPFAEGLTNDQLFFVAFAQTWCMKASQEFEQMLVTVDSHSPGKFRVVGPVSNSPEFARAFGCAEGTPMNPVNKCEVW